MSLVGGRRLLACRAVTDSNDDRRAFGMALAVALLVAFYRGFRAPNIWSVTLQTVSLFDGFHRRFLVGTVLRPFVAVFGYRYAVFACFSYLVLAILLWFVARAALRAETWSRRAIVLAWLLLPTGGFVFDEVGYFDQVLYLLLFAGLALIERRRTVAAACVIALAPMVHEIAILTVVPVFGWFALRKVAPRTAVLMTAPAAMIAGLVLLVPPITPAAIPTLEAALAHADFAFRVDALALFERTQSASWQLYSIRSQWNLVQATTFITVLGFVAVWCADRQLWRPASRSLRAGMLALSCLAIGAPTLLIFGGWDDNRWIAMLMTNFTLVLWLSFGGERRSEFGGKAASVLIAIALLLTHIQPYYFDLLKPRELRYRQLRHFVFEVCSGRELEIPQN